MSPAFSALVDLARSAATARVAGANLVLEVTASAESRALKDMIEEGNWSTASFRNDVEYTNPWSSLAEGEPVKLTVHGVARQNQVVANNLGALLRLSNGDYLRSPPEEFYLLDENFASWESPRHRDVESYERARKIRAVLERLADASKVRSGTGGELILFSGRKLIVPVVYDIASLSRVASDEQIANLEMAIFNQAHRDSRLEIAKRVLVRTLHPLSEETRFPTLLAAIPEVIEAFAADYEIYSASFSFEKAREDFERKKLDYIVKAGTATSDVLSKLIAIPVGQGLLASQMKTGSGAELVNAALLFASFAFAAVSGALLYNQFNTLTQLSNEFEAEVGLLKSHTPVTYDKLLGVIGPLRRRLAWHRWLVPIAMASLLVASTVFTCAAYRQSGSPTVAISPPDAIGNNLPADHCR